MPRRGRIPGAKNTPESRLRNGAELRQCLVCEAEFWVPRWQLREGGGKYCSRTCRHDGLRGKRAPRLPIGTRRTRADGYIEIATGNGRWPLEHRWVVEQALGRRLQTDEHVHHINGDRADNRLENLQVFSADEHARLHDHPQMRPRRVQLTCRQCEGRYEVKASKAAHSRYCSNGCRLAALHDGNRK